MQPAITAKLLPAAGKLPARAVARHGKRASFVPTLDYPTSQDALLASVSKLLRKLKDTDTYYAGTLPDGRLVFVRPNEVQANSTIPVYP